MRSFRDMAENETAIKGNALAEVMNLALVDDEDEDEDDGEDHDDDDEENASALAETGEENSLA